MVRGGRIRHAISRTAGEDAPLIRGIQSSRLVDGYRQSYGYDEISYFKDLPTIAYINAIPAVASIIRSLLLAMSRFTAVLSDSIGITSRTNGNMMWHFRSFTMEITYWT